MLFALRLPEKFSEQFAGKLARRYVSFGVIAAGSRCVRFDLTIATNTAPVDCIRLLRHVDALLLFCPQPLDLAWTNYAKLLNKKP